MTTWNPDKRWLVDKYSQWGLKGKDYGPSVCTQARFRVVRSEHEKHFIKLHCQIPSSCTKYLGRRPKNTNDVSGCLPALGQKKGGLTLRVGMHSSRRTPNHQTSLWSTLKRTAMCLNGWPGWSMVCNYLGLPSMNWRTKLNWRQYSYKPTAPWFA